MPNWRKVAVSGSAASFSSLSINTSITASIVSGSLYNLQNNIVGHIPFFSQSQILTDSAMFQVHNGDGSTSIAINENGVTTAAPEALFVFQDNTSSYNVISGKGNLNNYLQLNIQNTNAGSQASSDIVATADNGNEITNFIDLGINNQNFAGTVGAANDAYLYSAGNALLIGNTSPSQPLNFFVGSTNTDIGRKLQLNTNDQHNITGSLNASQGFTGSLFGSASYASTASYFSGSFTGSVYGSASYAETASYALTASYFSGSFTGSMYGSASYAESSSYALTASYFSGSFTGSMYGSASYAISSSYALTASYVANASSFPYTGSAVISGSLTVVGPEVISGSLSVTGSITLIGNTVLSGSIAVSGSQTFTGVQYQIGSSQFTGSVNITGSTVQVGNNTLLGNTTLSGSIIISGSKGQPNPTISIFGDLNQTGYTRYLPVTNNIDNSISASYIYVSGSTQDLYFTQNGAGYSNTTRLRWLEGNMYTGLLNGGIITTSSSTVYQVSSGSGIIVNLNASLNDNPYPTIQYLNWSNLSASIAPLSASYDQAFVGVDSTGNIFQQGAPFSDGQFNVLINIGVVLFQNNSTINGVKTQPSVAYGFQQAQNTFNRAFGPLKLSGYTLAVSGSSTGSLVLGSGTAYAPGANYTVDPNNPNYETDSGTNTSKIFRYYDSGSGTNSWVYDTNGGAGYATINPGQYSNNGTLSSVANNRWSIQRCFWYPNSVTKAVVVYYGNEIYTTQAEAIANIQYEYFVEAPNTAANAIYLGALVVRGNAVFTDTNSFSILPGGLFRQVGGSGGGGSTITQTLSGLSDVSISGQTNLQPLAYSTTAGKWINTSILSASVVGNATTATSASYAATSSWALSSISSSYALTASYVQNAQTASYILQAISSSYSLSSSYALSASNARTASFVTTAQTASYVLNAVTASFVATAQTASYVLNAVSASRAISAANADTASYVITAQTASYVLNAVSASRATSALNADTASYVLNAVSASRATSALNADTASYVVNAISASYAATASRANATATTPFIVGGTATYYGTVNSSIVGSNNVFTIATGSYTAATFQYTAYSGSNSRAGQVIATWNNGNTQFTDFSTPDNGTTVAVTSSVVVITSQLQFNFQTNTSGWTIKSQGTLI